MTGQQSSFNPALSPSNTAQPALVVDNVVKKFGSTTAVNGLSFSVGVGEVVALLGPNGAGKTTTIEMCEGFLTPTSGQIRVLGDNPATDPQKVRDRIGIMLQGGGAYPGVRAKEMIELTASYYADPLDVDWLVDVVGLKEHASRPYRRLSGGQQQRLSLALALVGRPELVFLDEPTAGMDAQSRRGVWELVSALRRDGVTIVLTTHLMDEAEALADRVIIIDHGKRVAEGTPGEIIHHSDTTNGVITFTIDQDVDVARLKQLFAASPQLQAAAESLTHTGGLSYEFSSVITPDTVHALASVAADNELLLRQFSVGHRSLEEAFLDITGSHLR